MSERYPHLLQRLQAAAPGLPRAQKQVIAVLLQDPERALSMSVDALAAQAQVSMPTIMRTARQMGFEGVREFKLALAKDLARHAHVHRSVTMQDSTSDIVQKILSSAAGSINALQQQLDPAVLEKSAKLLARAERIDCYSVGATSAFMANDLQGRLFRLGRHAHAVSDAHQQLISAAIERLEHADAALTRGDAQQGQMDVLVARNSLRALIPETAELTDIMSGGRRNAA
jgi:DNA-binding MurR/RpiR family transcriptional regulator